jgi:hypothetical protein
MKKEEEKLKNKLNFDIKRIEDYTLSWKGFGFVTSLHLVGSNMVYPFLEKNGSRSSNPKVISFHLS